MSTFLSIAEIEEMCHPLKQPAAMRRWITQHYKLPIRGERPSGHPLILRSDLEAPNPTEAHRPNREKLRKVIDRRKAA